MKNKCCGMVEGKHWEECDEGQGRLTTKPHRHFQNQGETMNPKTPHTPTVNEVLTELSGVLHRIPQAHRDIIIRAINAHDELLRALRAFEERYQKLAGFPHIVDPFVAEHINATEAIAQAEVQS